jgi:hypothetical protein
MSAGEFPVVELRRYVTTEGAAEEFATYFDAYFPETFQQLGAIVFGQFLERGRDDGFAWLRGFADVDARATVNPAFYDGPLWKERAKTMNDRLVASENVLPLRPVDPQHGIPLLPVVDPVREAAGARGVVVAQILAVEPGGGDALCERAEPSFAGYREMGIQPAGLLVTLDVPNNFPRLPMRSDGPLVVWLGVAESDEMVRTHFEPAAQRAADDLVATGLLRGEPELLVLDPTPRSRLRWLG